MHYLLFNYDCPDELFVFHFVLQKILCSSCCLQIILELFDLKYNIFIVDVVNKHLFSLIVKLTFRITVNFISKWNFTRLFRLFIINANFM